MAATTAAKSKAGRGGAQCARASVSPPSPPHGTAVGGQVARPDGRRLWPSERGPSDHWRSHRPFLRHRLDDRSCPSTASCAAPALQHCVSLTHRRCLLLNIRPAPLLHTITQVSLKSFLFYVFQISLFHYLRVH